MTANVDVDYLEHRGVLDPTPDRSGAILSEGYRARIQKLESEFEDDEVVGAISEQFGEDQERIDHWRLFETDTRFVIHLLALADFIDDLGFDWAVQLVLIVQWFDQHPPKTSGVPDGFLPILGDQIPVIMQLYSPGILYVWREDCDPCDIVREDFESLLDDPDDLGLFAVYGPVHAELLNDQYNVVGGPTTLFFADGQIITRLQGAFSRKVLDNEIEKIRSR